MSELSELLKSANSAYLSARAIASAAQQFGFSLNHDTAARYLRGDHGRPKEATLRALSSVLDIPLAKLRSAAALPTEVTEPYRPPVEASQLNRRQRRAVDEIIRAMLAAPSQAQPVDQLRPKTGRRPARPQAARRGSAEPPGS
jgi:transcriptional regulator with XRE-family HTH domain